MRPVLHVLGCGRAARSLARVFAEKQLADIGQIVNSSLASAVAAADFIGAGTPMERFEGDLSGDWVMIGLPDGRIEALAGQWADRSAGSPALAFHLSGSMSSTLLAPLGKQVAAVHPLKAFADPNRAASTFEGTWCVAEGHSQALQALQPLFESAGGRWVEFEPVSKPAWHAATIAASNFLVVTSHLARSLATAAGVEEREAAAMLADLQRGTLENVASSSPVEALTGPFERGDAEVARGLHSAVHEILDAEQAAQFDAFARAVLALAKRKRGERSEDELISQVLNQG